MAASEPTDVVDLTTISGTFEVSPGVTNEYFYVESTRGKANLYIGQFKFQTNGGHRLKNGKFSGYWTCIGRAGSATGGDPCDVRATTTDGQLTKLKKMPHNHPPITDPNVERFQLRAKEKVLAEPERKIKESYQSALKEVIDEGHPGLAYPPAFVIKNALYNRRYQSIPANTADEIPEEFQVTLSGKKFLQYADAQLAIFFEDSFFELFCQSPTIFADGTFKVCPRTYFQLYTLHFEFKSVTFPGVYVLMKDKTFRSYDKLLNKLNELAADNPIQATRVNLDFERAATKAFKKNLPSSQPNGCFFHFAQAVIRKVGKLGMITEYYRSAGDFRFFVRTLINLAFLPVDQVALVYAELVGLVRDDVFTFNFEFVSAFLEYFEKN